MYKDIREVSHVDFCSLAMSCACSFGIALGSVRNVMNLFFTLLGYY